MAYNEFQYPAIIREFGLTERSELMFPDVPGVAPSELLRKNLRLGVPLATAAHSEVARSIWMVGPLLMEFWSRAGNRINLFAGVGFTVDRDARLSGNVDFLVCRGPQLHHVTAPVLLMFEAKRDSIPEGFGQCIAAMIGAQRFNRSEGDDTPTVYGCVTTGSQWKFLRLEGNLLTADLDEYSIREPDKLLGILSHITGVASLTPV